jgi:hypothetical protein
MPRVAFSLCRTTQLSSFLATCFLSDRDCDRSRVMRAPVHAVRGEFELRRSTERT